MTLRTILIATCVAALPVLGGCKEEAGRSAGAQRAVRVTAVQPQNLDQTVTLTGTIAARNEISLSFRTSGQVVERLVDVGSHVSSGQVLARLDTRSQVADVESARAGVAAAEAQVKLAAASFERVQALFSQGFTTRREFDQASSALKVGRANADSARSQLASAEETLSYADLRAPADGIVTSRLLDVGETAQAAATVFTVALDGPRDALFDIYEGLLLEGKPSEPVAVTVSLVGDPSVSAKGQVRQVAPSVDAQTAAVRVKVGLEDAPAAMTLGAAVSGTGVVASPSVYVLPAAAMTSQGGAPALWVLDAATSTVALRPVRVRSYGSDSVVVDGGLSPGERVVVDGTKLLRPGQVVAIAQEAATR